MNSLWTDRYQCPLLTLCLYPRGAEGQSKLQQRPLITNLPLCVKFGTKLMGIRIEKMIVFLIHFLPSFEKIKLPLRYFGYFFNCFSFWEVGCAKIFVKSFCLYMTQRYSSNFFQLPTEGVSHHTHHLDPKLFFVFFAILCIFFSIIFSPKV